MPYAVKRPSAVLASLALLAAIHCSTASAAGLRIYLKIDGLSGQTPGRAGEFVLLATTLSFGSVVDASGRPMRAITEPLTVTTGVDASTAEVIVDSMNPKPHQNATLTFEGTSVTGMPTPVLVVSLSNVRINEVKVAGQGAEATATWSLGYGNVLVSVRGQPAPAQGSTLPQNPPGTPVNPNVRVPLPPTQPH
jgi:type VI protein secretion system component Hcp